MIKLFIGIFSLAVVSGGAYWAWTASSGAEIPGPPVKTSKVRRGTLTYSLQASGEVRPKRLIEIKSKASGQITRFRKIEGDAVSPEEILVELDPVTETRNFERAKAQEAVAKARQVEVKNEATREQFRVESDLTSATEDLAVKQAEHDRLKKLTSRSKKELEQAALAVTVANEKKLQLESELRYLELKQQTDRALAASQVVLAEITVREAEDRLADTRVRPPIEGTLLQKLVEEGQIVSSGISSVSGGTTLATVADLSELIIIANIVESDIGKVVVGQRARVGVDAFPGRSFAGRVIHIPPHTEVDAGVAHFKVRVAVPGAEAREFLRVGMTADISLLIEEKENVLIVPSQAVVKRKGKAFLRRPGGETTPVEVGMDTGLDCEILTGISEGDQILVPMVVAENPRWMRRR